MCNIQPSNHLSGDELQKFMKKRRMTKWPVLFQVSCCNFCQVVGVRQELDISQGQNPSLVQLLPWEKHLTPHWQSTGFTLLTIYLPRVSHLAVFPFHILLTWQRRIELCLWASVLPRNRNDILTILVLTSGVYTYAAWKPPAMKALAMNINTVKEVLQWRE